MKIKAVIETSRGTINLDLFAEEAPVTVASCESFDKQFYDGLKFHRVISNFMIQGEKFALLGLERVALDRFEDEFNKNLRHDGPGILSMANAGPGTNGSQFFITHLATPHLDDAHTMYLEKWFPRATNRQWIQLSKVMRSKRFQSKEITNKFSKNVLSEFKSGMHLKR